MKPAPLTIISHFYNNINYVIDQLNHWSNYSGIIRGNVNFILVDDCSSEPYDNNIFREHSDKININLLRITDDIAWNQGGSRNLGVCFAKSEWIILIDIDQLLYEPFVSEVVDGILRDRFERDVLYHFRIKELVNIQNNESLIHHPNSFLVNRAMFLEFGMYDEDFAGGYGYEDVYLMKQWVFHGMRRSLIDRLSCEDMPFGTENLDRDLSRNLQVAIQKMSSGDIIRSTGLLRFRWTTIF